MMIPMESWKNQLLKTLVVVLLGGYIVAQGGLSWAYSAEGLSGSGISPTLIGQDDQAGGDDGYLWYYRVDKLTTFP